MPDRETFTSDGVAALLGPLERARLSGGEEEGLGGIKQVVVGRRVRACSWLTRWLRLMNTSTGSQRR